MGFWEVLLLAVVQGITEFLPVSSSGHLVILAAWLTEGDVESLDVSDLNIVLHLGTLLAILVFYRQRVRELLGTDRRVIPRLIVATIPAVLVGVPIKLFLEEVLSSPWIAGLLLIVTGVVLLATARLKAGTRTYRELGWGECLWLGTAQAAAILPGLSRSGSTICAGLGQRLEPRAAATFSFLMAIPAIGGAGVLEALSLLKDGGPTTSPLNLAAGAGVAFLVGLVSLWWLVRWVERGRLWCFAFWCIPLGVAVTWWGLQTAA